MKDQWTLIVIIYIGGNIIMAMFDSKQLSTTYDLLAPDGSEVRMLLALDNGSMAHFTLPPGQVSTACIHETVSEFWYILSGQGEMWRKKDGKEEVIVMQEGLSLTIPSHTNFQFRTIGDEPFKAVGVTMPPWPGENESTEVQGPWKATV